MGILERMRSGSDSTGMQVVVALIIVAFVGLYINPQGDRSNIVAEVDGAKIMDTTYSRAYRAELSSAEQRAGRTLSDPEQKQLAEQVKQGLIERQVLLHEADRLGVVVSDAEVARQLLQIDFLKRPDGTFDAEAYQRFLKRQQYNAADFEEQLREDLVRAKLQQLVFTGASMSEPAIREAYVESQTRVDLTVVRIRSAAFEDDVTITDEERATWIRENDALLTETYERDKERLYTHPEQARLRMIRLSVTPDGPPLSDLVPRLNALRDRIAGGADMADLAKRWSEDPSALDGGDLGLRDVALLSDEVAKAIEGLPVGAVSKVVPTKADARFVRVEERAPPKVDTLDEVKDSIADRLIRAERVPALAAKFAEEELLARWRETGVVPEDLLAAQGLAARPTGPIPTTATGNPFAPPQGVLDDARTAPVGSVLPEVYEEAGVLYVAQLTARTEPDLATFEAQKEEIREQVLMQRRIDFYESWVADLKAQAKITQ